MLCLLQLQSVMLAVDVQALFSLKLCVASLCFTVRTCGEAACVYLVFGLGAAPRVVLQLAGQMELAGMCTAAGCCRLTGCSSCPGK